MAKIVGASENPKVFYKLQDIRDSNINYGSLVRGMSGDVFMVVYVYSSVRSDRHEEGTFLVNLGNGEVYNDEYIFPVTLIERGEQIILEQE